MKISLVVLLVFGLAAVIAAVPAQDKPEEEQLDKLEELDIPGKNNFQLKNYNSLCLATKVIKKFALML